MVPIPRAAQCPALDLGCEMSFWVICLSRDWGVCLFFFLFHFFTEAITLETVAWGWVSFTIPGFVEPQTLFLVPIGAVKSTPQAAETRRPARVRPAQHQHQPS